MAQNPEMKNERLALCGVVLIHGGLKLLCCILVSAAAYGLLVTQILCYCFILLFAGRVFVFVSGEID